MKITTTLIFLCCRSSFTPKSLHSCCLWELVASYAREMEKNLQWTHCATKNCATSSASSSRDTEWERVRGSVVQSQSFFNSHNWCSTLGTPNRPWRTDTTALIVSGGLYHQVVGTRFLYYTQWVTVRDPQFAMFVLFVYKVGMTIKHKIDFWLVVQ